MLAVFGSPGKRKKGRGCALWSWAEEKPALPKVVAAGLAADEERTLPGIVHHVGEHAR